MELGHSPGSVPLTEWLARVGRAPGQSVGPILRSRLLPGADRKRYYALKVATHYHYAAIARALIQVAGNSDLLPNAGRSFSRVMAT